MSVKFSNNAVTTLTAGISVGATSFTVASASLFPALAGGDWTYVTIGSEVIKITAISGTTFTCDATSNSHSTGDNVELRMTAELLNDFAEDTEAVPVTGGTFTGAITAPDFIGPLNGAVQFTAKNDEGVAITKGQVVYIKGVSGDVATVGLADANDSAKMPAFGLVFAGANNNAEVEIVTFGSLKDTKTDYTGWSLGDTLYVSTTAGALTNSAPTGEAASIQNIGKIQRVHASAGIIKVGGAGRTNATPNLNDGNVFIGNASNQAAARALVIGDTTGLQTALDGKVDDSQVLTNVPSGAVFTDTVYDSTAIDAAVALNTAKVTNVTTNLSTTTTATTNTVVSSDGTNAVLPAATTSVAGMQTAADKTKLDGIEALADVTDTTNVTAAGALMDSEVTNLAAVKAFATTDYATAAQGATANAALPKAGGAMTGAITTTSTFDGRDVATDGTKLDTIATSANNYSHPANHAISVTTGLQAALDSKAPLASPALTGAPTAPTAAANTNTTQVATTAYVQTEVTDLIGGAPGTLDTLNELAAAINDDASYASTLTTALGTKVAKTSNQALSTAANAMTISGHTITLNRGDSTTDTVTVPDNNTTYSVGDGGLSEINFTSADHSKLNGIETGATADQTNAQIKTAYEANADSNEFSDAEKTKLSGVATSANNYSHPTTAGNKHIPTGGASGQFLKYSASGTAVWASDNDTTYSVGDGGLTAKNFTTTLKTKLDGIATSANNYTHPTGAGNLHVPTAGTVGQVLTNTASGTGTWQDAAAGGASDIDGLTDGYTGSDSVGLGSGALNSDDGTANKNTAVGYQSGYSITTGAYNTANGYKALTANVTGIMNTATGSLALYQNTGNYNTANGTQALYANTTGTKNTASGYQSMYGSTTGSNNTAFGYNSLYSNTTGYDNVALGANAGGLITSGHSNVAIGREALNSTTTGHSMVAIGKSALYYNTTGSNNAAVGKGALYANTTGQRNTAFGYNASNKNTTGSYNFSLGNETAHQNTTGSNNIAIGDQCLYNNNGGIENIAIGNFVMAGGTCSKNVGIGFRAFQSNTTGSYNTAIGHNAAYGATTATYNTCIGYQAGYFLTTGSYNTIIGKWSGNQDGLDIRTLSNRIVIADGAGSIGMYITNTGDAHFDGDVVAYSTTISDERLKENITTIDNALDKVNQIRGVEFTRTTNGEKSAGVIAQELEKVLPNAIKEKELPLQTGGDKTSYKTVEYDAIHGLLIEAIKELSAKVEALEKA